MGRLRWHICKTPETRVERRKLCDGWHIWLRLYVGIGQVENGRLYLRYWSSSEKNNSKVWRNCYRMCQGKCSARLSRREWLRRCLESQCGSCKGLGCVAWTHLALSFLAEKVTEFNTRVYPAFMDPKLANEEALGQVLEKYLLAGKLLHILRDLRQVPWEQWEHMAVSGTFTITTQGWIQEFFD